MAHFEVKTLNERDLNRADLMALIAVGYKPETLRARLIAENGEIVEPKPVDAWSSLDLVSKSFR